MFLLISYPFFTLSYDDNIDTFNCIQNRDKLFDIELANKILLNDCRFESLKQCNILIPSWVVVVAQLVERSLPTQDMVRIQSSAKFTLDIVYCQLYWKDENKVKVAGNGPFFEKCLAKSQEGQQLLNAVNCQFRVCNKYRRGRSLQSCHTSSLGELSESSKMCSTKEPIGDVNDPKKSEFRFGLFCRSKSRPWREVDFRTWEMF